jgi:hypothetical protein
VDAARARQQPGRPAGAGAAAARLRSVLVARTQSVLVGANTVGMTRVGNYIRAFGFIGRDASGVRTNASLPDPFQFNWDGMSIINTSQNYMRQKLYESTNGTSRCRPASSRCCTTPGARRATSATTRPPSGCPRCSPRGSN